MTSIWCVLNQCIYVLTHTFIFHMHIYLCDHRTRIYVLSYVLSCDLSCDPFYLLSFLCNLFLSCSCLVCQHDDMVPICLRILSCIPSELRWLLAFHRRFHKLCSICVCRRYALRR